MTAADAPTTRELMLTRRLRVPGATVRRRGCRRRTLDDRGPEARSRRERSGSRPGPRSGDGV